MALQQDDLKEFVSVIGKLIDARLQTFAINFKSELREEFRQAIRESEERIRNDMATKDDLKNFATKDDINGMATKQDIQRLEKRLGEKIDRQGKTLIKRIEVIEDTLHLPHYL